VNITDIALTAAIAGQVTIVSTPDLDTTTLLDLRDLGTPVIYVNPAATPEELAADLEEQLRWIEDAVIAAALHDPDVEILREDD
jgi:hypothetical protein